MEGQMAKSRCTGLGHKGATHNPQRLNVAQLIGDVPHQLIPHPCPGALLVNFLPDSPTRIFTIEPAVDARPSRQVLLSFIHHCLDINLRSHGLAGGRLWSA